MPTYRLLKVWSRIWCIEFCHFHWSWTTPSTDFTDRAI